MKLTVDASVVVKWFVSESFFDEARLLLAHRLDLHAPDILLAEFANVIWKKARRSEIPKLQPYIDELSHLSDIIVLHPVHNLITRAVQITEMIDHPVYDCLYLACAEATKSILVTADHKFTNKVLKAFPSVDVRYIGADGFADQIATAATTRIN